MSHITSLLNSRGFVSDFRPKEDWRMAPKGKYRSSNSIDYREMCSLAESLSSLRLEKQMSKPMQALATFSAASAARYLLHRLA